MKITTNNFKEVLKENLNPNLTSIGSDSEIEDYLGSVARDIVRNGLESKYINWEEEDYKEDFRNYLSRNSLDERKSSHVRDTRLDEEEIRRMQYLAGITEENDELYESYQNQLHTLLGDVGTDEEIDMYIDSLNTDPSKAGYEDYTDEDFIEDFINYVSDKSL